MLQGPPIPVALLTPAQAEPGANDLTSGEGQPADPRPAGGGSSWVAPILGAFGILVLIQTLFRAYRRNASKESALSQPPRERLAEVRAQADARRDPVERLMAEATELCQRLATQMDAKAAVLEALIDRAEAAATRLEHARGGSPSLRSAGDPPNPEEPMQRRVFELADQGMNSRDIAARVGQPQGHVELMLNLRRA